MIGRVMGLGRGWILYARGTAGVRLPRPVVSKVAVGLAFFLAAKVGHLVAIEPGTITPIWLPSGIALAGVLVIGPAVWPGIWIAAFLAGASAIFSAGSAWHIGRTALDAALMATGSTIEPLCGAALFRRLCPRGEPFDSVRNLVCFVLVAGFAACSLSATIGVGVLRLTGLLSQGTVTAAWVTWWIGNTLGVILVTPMLLTWRTVPRWRGDWRMVSLAALLWALIAALSVVIFSTHAERALVLAMALAILPLVVWSSYSFGAHGATVAGFTFAFLALVYTSNGLGPFASQSLNTSLLLSQFSIGIVVTTGLLMSAASTHRERLERSAQDLSAHLAYSGRLSLTGELAAGIAHEVHQPLGVIANYANSCAIRIRRGVGSPNDLLEPLEQIVLQTTRAANVVRGIRRLLSNDSPRVDSVDLAALVDDSIRMAVVSDTTGRVTIRSMVGDGVRHVSGDATQIMQVLVNLLVNAIDALSGQESPLPHIDVAARRCSRRVEVTVADNGPGVGTGDPERCFERFYTTKTGGLGMGLAISRTIVESHGGQLTAADQRGGGTIFRFTLAEASPPPDGLGSSSGGNVPSFL